jgi:hypothetical protein
MSSGHHNRSSSSYCAPHCVPTLRIVSKARVFHSTWGNEQTTEVDRAPWMDAPDNETLRVARMTQRFALAALHCATSRTKTWIDSRRWLNPTLHECDWLGCSCRASDWHVDSIALDDNGLAGFLPPRTAPLSTLTSLRFYFNGLTGPIPTELGRIATVTKRDISWARLGSTRLDSTLQYSKNSPNATLSWPVERWSRLWLGRLVRLGHYSSRPSPVA